MSLSNYIAINLLCVQKLAIVLLSFTTLQSRVSEAVSWVALRNCVCRQLNVYTLLRCYIMCNCHAASSRSQHDIVVLVFGNVCLRSPRKAASSHLLAGSRLLLATSSALVFLSGPTMTGLSKGNQLGLSAG
jgi:hypothetical protein